MSVTAGLPRHCSEIIFDWSDQSKIISEQWRGNPAVTDIINPSPDIYRRTEEPTLVCLCSLATMSSTSSVTRQSSVTDRRVLSNVDLSSRLESIGYYFLLIFSTNIITA